MVLYVNSHIEGYCVKYCELAWMLHTRDLRNFGCVSDIFFLILLICRVVLLDCLLSVSSVHKSTY